MTDQTYADHDLHTQGDESKRKVAPHDVDESGNPLNSSSTTQKRKRDASDHDGSAIKSGPESNARRSSFKRVSPNTNSSTMNNISSNGQDLSDQSSSSFLQAHSGSNAPTEEDMHESSHTSLDFGTLSQHNAGDGATHQNGGPDMSDATSTAAAALAGIFPTMTVPQPTGLSFESTGSGGEGVGDYDGNQNQHDPTYGLEALREGQQSMRESSTGGGSKPAVGSDEWHKVRRDNHKEVERRRRETINEGINELAKIVPGCEKNKGSILQRAVSFITQLKENEAQNIEKWTLEKLLTEQAIAELSASVDKLKNECERAWREAETWKKTCQSAGLTPKRSEDSVTGNASGEN
ncbi:MAG: basic helix-loop-helix protein [Pycnora praestabilis]|nr:MAG: basic helix-loop-helix protein [Pycnora praestabilis]